VPEAPPTKRQAVTRGAGAAAAKPSAAAAAPAAAKPAAADETWDDIAAATGMSINDLLSKKLAFKKTARADDKLKEMQPLVKNLRWARGAGPPRRRSPRCACQTADLAPPARPPARRAAGWHLLTAKEKAEMDVQQWKQALEQVEQEQKQAEQEWAGRQAEMDKQAQDARVRAARRRRAAAASVTRPAGPLMATPLPACPTPRRASWPPPSSAPPRCPPA
jgi:hypothetical protein